MSSENKYHHPQKKKEGGELQLDPEQLIRAALVTAEHDNAPLLADLWAISRASIDDFNQAIAQEIPSSASAEERAHTDKLNRAAAEQILDSTMEQASPAEVSEAAAVEIFEPSNAARIQTVARVVAKSELALGA